MFRRTATGLSDLLDGAISHDQITRFLSREDYGSKELWQQVKPFVRQAESKTGGVLIFDDIIEEKPYTDENEVVCWHFDYTQQRSVKGINIVSALIRYDQVSFPVTYEIVQKTETYLDANTGKEKRKSNRSKNALFREMLCQCMKNYVKFQYVLADIWFASKENMVAVLKHHKHFVFALMANRMVALTWEEKRQEKFTSIESLDLEKDQAVRVYLKGLDVPVLLVKPVFTNKDGSTGESFLVCSDLSLAGPQIIETYQKTVENRRIPSVDQIECGAGKIAHQNGSDPMQSYFCLYVRVCQTGKSQSQTPSQSFCVEVQIGGESQSNLMEGTP